MLPHFLSFFERFCNYIDNTNIDEEDVILTTEWKKYSEGISLNPVSLFSKGSQEFGLSCPHSSNQATLDESGTYKLLRQLFVNDISLLFKTVQQNKPEVKDL